MLLFSFFRKFPLLLGAVYANRPPTVNPIFVLTQRRTYTLRKQWVLHPFQPSRGSSHIIKSIFLHKLWPEKQHCGPNSCPTWASVKDCVSGPDPCLQEKPPAFVFANVRLHASTLLLSSELLCLKIDWVLSFQIAVRLCSSRSHAVCLIQWWRTWYWWFFTSEISFSCGEIPAQRFFNLFWWLVMLKENCNKLTRWLELLANGQTLGWVKWKWVKMILR